MSGDKAAPEGVALLEWAGEHLRAQLVDVVRGDEGAAVVLVVPDGFEVKSLKPLLDEYCTAPERIKGRSTHSTPQSFVAHARRFATPASAIFATDAALTAVYNYHQPDAPAYGDHRAVYALPRSAAWAAWRAIDGKGLDQRAFAEWLEARAEDVVGMGSTEAHGKLEHLGLKVGTQADIVGLIKGLVVRVESEVADRQELATGASTLSYSTEVKGAKGEPLTVPAGFVVAVPVLDGAAEAHPVAVRLRFKVEGGRVKWSMHLLGADQIEREALASMVDFVASATGLPVFHGTPE